MARFILFSIITLIAVKSCELRNPDGTCCKTVRFVGSDDQVLKEHPKAFGIYHSLVSLDGYGADNQMYKLLRHQSVSLT